MCAYYPSAINSHPPRHQVLPWRRIDFNHATTRRCQLNRLGIQPELMPQENIRSYQMAPLPMTFPIPIPPYSFIVNRSMWVGRGFVGALHFHTLACSRCTGMTK